MEDNILMGSSEVNEESTRFGQAILDTLSEHPDFVGVIDAKSGEKIRFVEMKNLSIRCALWLRKQGVEENDVIGVLTPIQKYDYVPFLGTLFINAIFNPWQYDASSANVLHFLESCRPKVVFACKESIGKLAESAKKCGTNCKFVVFEKYSDYPTLQDILSQSTQDEIDNFECVVPSDPKKKISAIYWSSGTTGTPKSILLSYHTISRRYSEEYGLRSGMTCLWHLALHSNACRSFTSTAILLRCTRVVQRDFDVEESSEALKKYKVNFIYWTPFYLLSCYQAGVFARNDLPNLMTVAIAGAKANRVMLEECQKALPRIFIKNSYGITEAGGLIAQQNESRKSIHSVGFLCSGVQLKVVDPNTGRILGANQEGELHIKTDTVMLGYLGNPEKTRQTVDQNGWLHTGDLGSYDDDGEITVSGRIKQIIRTKSYLLSSYDFEEPLMQHPDVRECAVVAVEHPIDNERPFAFVVKARNAKVTAEELIEFSARQHERYRLTGGLVFVDKLPYTPSGKKCIKILEEMAKIYAH